MSCESDKATEFFGEPKALGRRSKLPASFCSKPGEPGTSNRDSQKRQLEINITSLLSARKLFTQGNFGPPSLVQSSPGLICWSQTRNPRLSATRQNVFSCG